MSNAKKEIAELLDLLEEREKTPHGFCTDLKLHFADIVISQMKAQGISQKELAEKIAKSEGYISRIMNSGSNCTLMTISQFSHALGIKPKLTFESIANTQDQGIGESHGQEGIEENFKETPNEEEIYNFQEIGISENSGFTEPATTSTSTEADYRVRAN